MSSGQRASCVANANLNTRLLLTLKPGPGLKEGFLQRAVQVEVEALVLSDVVTDPWEQNQVVEALGHALLQVGGEDPAQSSGLVQYYML